MYTLVMIKIGAMLMKNFIEFFRRKKDEDVDEEYESKLREHKIKKIKKYGILLAIILVVIIAIYIFISNKTYTEYSVVQNVAVGDTTKSRYYEYGEYFLRYSDDGLTYYNGTDVIWDHGFEMKQPIIDICKDYVAIAELGTNDIYIFDTTGLQGKVKTSYPIIGLEVANQGVVAVITEDKETNRIEVFDKGGNLIAEGKTVLSGDGCPVDLSLSEDGSKLMVSYLYVSEGVPQTRVVFYNYSEVGKNEVDRIVGGFNQYKSTVVPKVEFVTNDIAVAFGDNMFTIYSIKQKPSILLEETFEQEIKSIIYSDEYVGFVFEPEVLDEPYTIKIYEVDGSLLYEGKLELSYKNIKLDGDTIVAYSEEEIFITTVDGKIKYSGKCDMVINEVIGLDASYKYVLVTTESIDEIKLK